MINNKNDSKEKKISNIQFLRRDRLAFPNPALISESHKNITALHVSQALLPEQYKGPSLEDGPQLLSLGRSITTQW